MGWIKNDELIIFTKQNRSSSYQLFLISIISSYIVIIAFHLHDQTVWIIIIIIIIIIRVHVHWTKLESANIYSKEKTRYFGLFVRTTIMHMRATQHFDRGLLLSTQRKEKNFKETHWNIFGVFDFLRKVKQEREKLFTRESSQQPKEEREIFLGFLLIVLLNKHGKEISYN